MIDLPPPQTPAGWYADGVAGKLRWWDGGQWTERTRPVDPDDVVVDPDVSVGAVRGVTGYAEVGGSELLYRPKPDRPPLQRIDLHTVQQVVVSPNGNTFDVILVGAKPRRRPSLLSETSLQRSSRTPVDEWVEFLRRLETAVEAAVPKFRVDDTRR